MLEHTSYIWEWTLLTIVKIITKFIVLIFLVHFFVFFKAPFKHKSHFTFFTINLFNFFMFTFYTSFEFIFFGKDFSANFTINYFALTCSFVIPQDIFRPEPFLTPFTLKIFFWLFDKDFHFVPTPYKGWGIKIFNLFLQ